MNLHDIFSLVLIVAALSFSIFVVLILKRIVEHDEALRKDFNNFVENAIPVLSNLREITNSINRITNDIEVYWGEIEGFIKKLRGQISNITSLKQYYTVDSPVNYIIKNIKALAKAVSAFREVFKQK
jgi:hypothetical protein